MTDSQRDFIAEHATTVTFEMGGKVHHATRQPDKRWDLYSGAPGTIKRRLGGPHSPTLFASAAEVLDHLEA